MPWQVKHRRFGIIQIALPTFIRILSALHEWSLTSDQHKMTRLNSVNFRTFRNIRKRSKFWKFLEIDYPGRIPKAVQFSIFWSKLIFLGENHGNILWSEFLDFRGISPRSTLTQLSATKWSYLMNKLHAYENYIHRVKTGIFQILEQF